MKGIILSGGSGTRLSPLTKVTSKQLLPIYNKPMIFYPLETLLRGGVKDILIIVAPDRAGDYLRLLGSGKEFGARFSYEIQDKPEGLAYAFLIGEKFIGDDNVCMILGDNIFFAEGESAYGGEDSLTWAIKNFKSGGHIFAKKVPDAERFGQVKFDDQMNALQIEEKPKDKISDFAITGLYIFDSRVVEAAKQAKPSARGELEITELHNWYLAKKELKVDIVSGEWIDAGTFESLFKASELARKKTLNQK
jgi:glucose-1-phosphate thymidylyltransferase